MKIKELKHNHSLTDLLKVILFSIVMLLPFFSVLTRSLYVICNKNAKDSYSNSQVISLKKIADSTSLIVGYQYQLDYETNNSYVGNGMKIMYSEISINWNTYISNLGVNNENINGFMLSNDNNINSIFLYDENGTYINHFSNIWGNTLNGFSFVLEEAINTHAFNYGNYKISYITYLQDTLDNAFEYSLNEIENNQLFSWTKNTGTYTAINAMCTGLEVEMPVIPVILTYWFLISVIYLVLDIVIKTITYITHIIGSRA